MWVLLLDFDPALSPILTLCFRVCSCHRFAKEYTNLNLLNFIMMAIAITNKTRKTQNFGVSENVLIYFNFISFLVVFFVNVLFSKYWRIQLNLLILQVVYSLSHCLKSKLWTISPRLYIISMFLFWQLIIDIKLNLQ